jgi:hypothetical protein
MSIKETFEADFTPFKAAVQGASLSIKSFTTDTEKVSSALGKMTDSFSGQKVIQQAHLMVEAIDRVGLSVSDLTQKELAQLGSTVNEAIGKMERLGLDVPDRFRDIAAEAKGAGQEIGGIGGAVESLAASVAGYFTLDAITRYVGAVIDAADQLQTMAQRAGLTLEETQRLDQIASQTSTTVETLAGAIQTLELRVGKGDDAGVTAAFKDLGIELKSFEQLGTYEKLLQINEGLRGMEDPAKRARVQHELLGNSWKELTPAMLADMRALGEGAHLMADENVEAMAQAKDDWDDYVKDVRAKLSSLVGPLVQLKGWIDKTLGPTGYRKGALEDALGGPELKDVLKSIPPLTLPVIESFSGVTHSYEELAAESAKWDEATRATMALNKEAADKVKEYWEGVGKVLDRVMGTDAIGDAQQWADVKARLDDLGVALTSLSDKELVDFDKSLGAALDAMARNGQGASDLSVKYGALQGDVRAALAQFREVGPALDTALDDAERLAADAAKASADYTQKLYDEARAQDAVAAATNAANAARAAALQQEMSAATGGEGGSGKIGYLPPRGSGDYEVLTTTSGNGAGSSYYTPARRAAGGPVAAGTSYLVGERGPELFTPGASGAISPNGAGAVVVQNTFHLVDTESNLARRVSEQIMRTVTQARRV